MLWTELRIRKIACFIFCLKIPLKVVKGVLLCSADTQTLRKDKYQVQTPVKSMQKLWQFVLRLQKSILLVWFQFLLSNFYDTE